MKPTKLVISSALLAAFVPSAGACTDSSSMVIRFDTDAPIADDGSNVLPLFDHLRIEVFPPGSNVPCGTPADASSQLATGACVNDFAVTASMFRAKQVSIGVPRLSRDGFRMRARLYLHRLANGGEPNPSSSIDVVASLPANTVEGGLVFFATDQAGQPADLATAPPLPPDTGGDSLAGTWPGAGTPTCSAAPPQNGAVCVPGGAYWMGSQDGEDVVGVDGGWHRLAIVSPFYLDAAEVTVAQFRARSLASGTTDPFAWTKGSGCTFTASPGPLDALPVTCVTRAKAAEYCKAVGGDLPTAAQLEYAATGLGRAPLLWEAAPTECATAVWGR